MHAGTRLHSSPLQQVPLRAGLQPAPPAAATLLPRHPRPAGQHQGRPPGPHTTQGSSSTARRRNLQQPVLGQAEVSYWRDADAMVLQMRKGRRQPQVTSLLQNFPSILILGTVPALETRHRVSAREAATRGEPGCREEHTKPREVRCTFCCDQRPTASPEEHVIKKTLQPHWSPPKVTASGGSLDTRGPA